jgi:Kef-type K+ transport system membrane component KefB
MRDTLIAGIPISLEFRLLAYSVLALAVALAAPRLFERMQLPGLLGLILAGAVLGPPGFGIIAANNETLELFAEIGKIMLMFLIGMEINLEGFRKARVGSLVFGVLTFSIPMTLGALVARTYDYSWTAAVLVGSLLASHTLLAFPILEKAGLTESRGATVAVGATIFSDIAALMTLSICATIHSSGFSQQQIVIQLVALVGFVLFVVLGLSAIARRLLARFRRSDDATLIVILLIMAVASIGAVLIRLEDIVGAFLAGLAANSVARSSRARENIRVVGTALFIPAFFFSIGTKFLIGPLASQIVSGPGLVFGLLAALLAGKFLAAMIAAGAFGYSASERGLIWSLTLPQVAATLAAAFVAFEVKNSQGIRLIDEPIIAAVLLLMLSTTILGPVLTARYARQLGNASAGVNDGASPR